MSFAGSGTTLGFLSQCIWAIRKRFYAYCDVYLHVTQFLKLCCIDVNSNKPFYKTRNKRCKKLNTIPQEIVLPMLNDVLSHLFLVFMSLMLHK